MRWLPIRLRLALGYALLLVAILAGVGVYLLWTLEASLLGEADETLSIRAASIERHLAQRTESSGLLSPDIARAELESLLLLEELIGPGIYVEVRDRGAKTIAASANLGSKGALPAPDRLIQGAAIGADGFASVESGHDRIRIYARPISQDGEIYGVVLIGESLHLLDSAVQRMRGLLLFASLGAFVVAVVLGWILTSRSLRPIGDITHLARDIARTGDCQGRIDLPAHQARDELAELGATFNEMLARIESTLGRQREFLADASHELRGPLMVVRGNLDLLAHDLPEEDRLACVREATGEVERMGRLVGDLLFLSEVDFRGLVEKEPFDLAEVVAITFDRSRELDQKLLGPSAHQMSLESDDSVMILGDRGRLDELLWNLLENARRYTPSGGKIAVELRRYAEIAELSVTDTGIGIAPEQQARIFERFYRVDKARSRGAGGAGLGLAIVRQIADAHGAQVRVRSMPGEGSVFTVVFPVQAELSLSNHWC